ncbi:MAG TPA: site-2 protease family protein [Planctomycetota bacterium]|jgi:Zn-dependent protease/CBS domain-containing protein
MDHSPSWTAGHGDFRPEISRRYLARRNSQLLSQRRNVAQVPRMPWSWHVGQLAGIDIYIHSTFLLLLIWLVAVYAQHGSTVTETIVGVSFVMVLFACVVLHELGHALTARRFGVQTRDITLLPIGGVARLERIPQVPIQELLVAIAGPAVNIAIAGVLWIVLFFSGFEPTAFDGLFVSSGLGAIYDLMQLNIVLAVFNLLPAFPMDGGRVLRALLAMKVPRLKATRIASLLGEGMAIVFGLIGFGIFGPPQPVLLFIALFVYMGASQEYKATRWEASVEGLLVSDAMITNFRTLVTTDPLSRAVTLLLQSTQHDFPVLDDQMRVVGLLLRQDLIAALSQEGGAELPVAKAMRKVQSFAKPDEPLILVFERMQNSQLPILPVFEQDGRLVGLLTMENVAEVVMVRNALQAAQSEHVQHAPHPGYM